LWSRFTISYGEDIRIMRRRGTTSRWEGGTFFLGEQLFKCLIKKYKDKICSNQMSFISLKSSQNIDILNDLAFFV
jgi:hypothetical protein